MSIYLDQLEAAARAATPGLDGFTEYKSFGLYGNTDNLAKYYAAASPDKILELIAELRKLRAELEYLGELHTEATVALRNKEIDIMLADNVSNLLAGSQWAGPIPKPEEKK